MPELTPAMAREIDEWLAVLAETELDPGVELPRWLAAQRAEITRLRGERDELFNALQAVREFLDVDV